MKELEQILPLVVGLCGTIYGIYCSNKSNRRNDVREIKTETEVDTILKLDIEYIKRSMDSLLLEQREANKKLASVNEEITKLKVELARLKETTKLVQARIDKIEEKEKS